MEAQLSPLVLPRCGAGGGGGEPPAAWEGEGGAGPDQRGADPEQGRGGPGAGGPGGGRHRRAEVVPAQLGAHGAGGAGRRAPDHRERVLLVVYARCRRHPGWYPADLSGKGSSFDCFLLGLDSRYLKIVLIGFKQGGDWEKVKGLFVLSWPLMLYSLRSSFLELFIKSYQ